MVNIELLASYPTIRGPLKALDKPCVTLREVLERLTALELWSEWVGMASRRRVVDEIEAEES